MEISVEADTCKRCGTLTKTAYTECSQCKRRYHKRCFLTDAGVEKSTSCMCVCCLSSVLTKVLRSKISRKCAYAAEFMTRGFCVIPLAQSDKASLLADELSKWSNDLLGMYKGFMQAYEYQVDAGKAPTLDTGYKNFRQRGEGRFEIIDDQISNRVIPLVSTSEEVQQCLQLLLSADKKIMSSGCFLSLGGSERQVYHTDGPPLSSVEDLLPYAINVFVPLVPLDGKNGTEFIPGSHIPGCDNQESTRPKVPLGSALLFDYRVIHRGLPNSRTIPRPCLYVTFSRSWYSDKYNFSASRYKRSLELPASLLETRDERMRRRLNKIE